jgi:ribosome-binding protein aMBF1 (putative translation factor)
MLGAASLSVCVECEENAGIERYTSGNERTDGRYKYSAEQARLSKHLRVRKSGYEGRETEPNYHDKVMREL